MVQPALRLLACSLAVCLALMSLGARPRAAATMRVSGSLVFWDQVRGFEAILAHIDTLTEISPFWYYVADDGGVQPYTTAAGGTYEDAAILASLRRHGLLVIPTVANIRDGQWNGPLVGRILADPSRRAAHVRRLVALAVDRAYDGIDIDYEDLAASDRPAFSTFVRELADALHAERKLVTVNVYAKTSEPGGGGGPQAQDWAALGRAADEVRLMTYEYHWSTSEAGPIAPITWVADVLRFARSVIPPERIVQGVPFYGYDWIGRSGTPQVWEDVMTQVERHRVSVNWDATSAAPWFEYGSGRERHTVWFENALSVEGKLHVGRAHGIGGVMLWRLAGEDPAVWPALRSAAVRR